MECFLSNIVFDYARMTQCLRLAIFSIILIRDALKHVCYLRKFKNLHHTFIFIDYDSCCKNFPWTLCLTLEHNMVYKQCKVFFSIYLPYTFKIKLTDYWKTYFGGNHLLKGIIGRIPYKTNRSWLRSDE